MTTSDWRARPVLITGATGTLGQALCAALERRGARVVRWDRDQASPLDLDACTRYLAREQPDLLFHLAIASRPTGADNEGWRVNVDWSLALARVCVARGCRLVFTSSAMVFSNDAKGPFEVDAAPDAGEGYGYEKRVCEERIPALAPGAVIARLGWQIGDAPGSNNMIDFLHARTREDGHVRASTRWLPACSFLTDTAEALLRLADADGGLYQLDSNDRWSFFDIARALSRRHGDAWPVVASDDFVYDQRLIDPRPAMPRLVERLPELS